MKGFHTDIEKDTVENEYFRKVLFTGPNSQLVVMALKPGEDIGMETHDKNDQFIRIEAGKGKAVMAGKEYPLKDGISVVVPAGTEHNIINTSKTESLKLYTVYSPAHHPDGTIHKTKAEAEAEEKKRSN
ncbi:MAG TPA: cupin domain-containing protein [Bellilinea sp.]|nr:cupin domain-containing protein [Bellilinea sp.]